MGLQCGGDGVHLTDFDYPVKKPPRTFRILAAGDSRNSTAIPIPSDPSVGVNEDVASSRVNTFSKKLEFLLNTEATLRDSNIHFEVLNFTHRGQAISSHACYEYLDLVKKYDIDLVLSLAGVTGYGDYFVKTITSEGIPSKSFDPEYMLQKTLSERATTAVAKDLLEHCKVLKIPVSEHLSYPGDNLFSLLCNGDEQIQNDLKEMTGRPLGLFQEKLNGLKTSGGKCPQYLIYYVPAILYGNDCNGPFWRDVCVQHHLNFLDLTEPYNDLKMGFYPAAKGHLTIYGNDLVALLLEHYLIEKKLIGF